MRVGVLPHVAVTVSRVSRVSVSVYLAHRSRYRLLPRTHSTCSRAPHPAGDTATTASSYSAGLSSSIRCQASSWKQQKIFSVCYCKNISYLSALLILAVTGDGGTGKVTEAKRFVNVIDAEAVTTFINLSTWCKNVSDDVLSLNVMMRDGGSLVAVSGGVALYPCSLSYATNV